jgi:hypothetical protein
MSKKSQRRTATAGVARSDSLRHAEWGAAILLTLLALLFHFRFLTHAGALWRDEVNSVEFAAMPSLHEIQASLQYDGFPPLSTLLLRGWMAAGLGAGDSGLRMFGFAVGVAFLAALWLACRMLRCPTPLLSLALMGLSPRCPRWIALAHGLGTLWIMATLGFIWKAIESPSAKWFVAAGIAAILSVQTMYQNAFPLFESASPAAGASDDLGRRTVDAVGTTSYGANIVASGWSVVIKTPASLNRCSGSPRARRRRRRTALAGTGLPLTVWVAVSAPVSINACEWRGEAGRRDLLRSGAGGDNGRVSDRSHDHPALAPALVLRPPAGGHRPGARRERLGGRAR